MRTPLLPPRRILIAIDDSSLSAHAADVGMSLARGLGADVALVHVVDQLLAYAPGIEIPPAQVLAAVQSAGRDLLHAAALRLQKDPPLRTFLAVGLPAYEIAKAAKEWQADLVVVGSHGHTGIKRLVLGSVAQGVLRNSPVPVVVVRDTN
jgi:nucleotide-binding universal stress UspA family protein